MIAGTNEQFAALNQTRSPKGFYRVESEEIWPDIDPYLMTRSELDEQIKKGIKMYEKYFPTGQGGLSLFEMTLIVVAVGAAAVYFAGAAAAAGGAGQAAASGAAASGATATANASGALTATAKAAGISTSTSAASFGAQAFSAAKSAAPYVKKVGGAMKVAGNNEADKFVKAADIVEGSSTVTDAAEMTFKEMLKERGMELQGEAAKKALRQRIKREQPSYAAWMRRRAAKQQKHNPEVQTSTQKSLMQWLPLATPFVLIALSER